MQRQCKQARQGGHDPSLHAALRCERSDFRHQLQAHANRLGDAFQRFSETASRMARDFYCRHHQANGFGPYTGLEGIQCIIKRHAHALLLEQEGEFLPQRLVGVFDDLT